MDRKTVVALIRDLRWHLENPRALKSAKKHLLTYSEYMLVRLVDGEKIEKDRK